MPDKKKVIVTELGGRIGNVLRDHLGDKYEFSGIDRIPLEGLDSLTSDLTDLDAIASTFEGKDIVVHLAAEPRHTPDIGWDLLMSDNVIATANVFEAARAGVSRINFSSMHVAACTSATSHTRQSPKSTTATSTLPPSPSSPTTCPTDPAAPTPSARSSAKPSADTSTKTTASASSASASAPPAPPVCSGRCPQHRSCALSLCSTSTEDCSTRSSSSAPSGSV